MSDEIYFRQRAETEARMVEQAPNAYVRSVHETLRKAYLARLETGRDDPRRQR